MLDYYQTNTVYNLRIISSTVRPGRKGPQVAEWIFDIAVKNENFNTALLDLALIDLPLMDEPNHPSLKKYQNEHTKKWSAAIDEADAFIFVTAEYDHNYPAPLRNALEYLQHEWSYKPAGIVSYGGVSAGTRAANSLKNDLASLRIVPIGDSVNFPLFKKNNFDEHGNFIANEISHKAADTMLKELLKWTKALKHMRENP
jgi:NAD(P)H-dependent FMN reductase